MPILTHGGVAQSCGLSSPFQILFCSRESWPMATVWVLPLQHCYPGTLISLLPKSAESPLALFNNQQPRKSKATCSGSGRPSLYSFSSIYTSPSLFSQGPESGQCKCPTPRVASSYHLQRISLQRTVR